MLAVSSFARAGAAPRHDGASRGEGDFLTLLKANKDVTRYLSDAEIEASFDLGFHLKHVDTIFRRVFGTT